MGVAVGITNVAVGGTGVGVSGMIKRVAARQARVERAKGTIHHKYRAREWACIRNILCPIIHPYSQYRRKTPFVARIFLVVVVCHLSYIVFWLGFILDEN